LDASLEEVGGLEEESACHAGAQAGCEVECYGFTSVSVCKGSAVRVTGKGDRFEAYPPTTCVSGRHLSCPCLDIYNFEKKNDSERFLQGVEYMFVIVRVNASLVRAMVWMDSSESEMASGQS